MSDKTKDIILRVEDIHKSYSGVEVLRGIRYGCSGIMIDASNLSLNDNIEMTKKVVSMCSSVGIAVEGEITKDNIVQSAVTEVSKELTPEADFAAIQVTDKEVGEKVNHGVSQEANQDVSQEAKHDVSQVINHEIQQEPNHEVKQDL